MILLKTESDLAAMRRAGRVVAQALEACRRLVEPGQPTRALDCAVADILAAHRAEPLAEIERAGTSYRRACSVSLNDEVSHAAPDGRTLRNGDLVTVDVACRVDGWCADAACTWPVGDVPIRCRQLLKAGQALLHAAIDAMAECRWWSEVVNERGWNERSGTSDFRLVERCLGHGIGRELHEDPQVSFEQTSARPICDIELRPGLVLAIEPVLTTGSGRVQAVHPGSPSLRTADGEPCVHFEHTVAVTRDGPQVLTAE